MPGPGAPSAIDNIIGEYQGQPVTVAERIEQAVRRGTPFGLACQSAGITRQTGYHWRNIAERKRIEAIGQNITDLTLTHHEQRCLAFADAVDRAEGEAVVRYQLIADRLADGIPRTKTVVKERRNAAGDLIETETVTTTETALPDGAIVRWWLEHRCPVEYGNRVDQSLRAERELEDTSIADAIGLSFDKFLESPEAQEIVEREQVRPSDEVVVGDVGDPPASGGPSPAARTKRKRDEFGRIVESSSNGDG